MLVLNALSLLPAQSYLVASLLALVEEATHTNLTGSTYQLQFQNKPLQAVRHGKQLSLRDCRIRKEETLFIHKLGFSLDITNPQVCAHSVSTTL